MGEELDSFHFICTLQNIIMTETQPSVKIRTAMALSSQVMCIYA